MSLFEGVIGHKDEKSTQWGLLKRSSAWMLSYCDWAMAPAKGKVGKEKYLNGLYKPVDSELAAVGCEVIGKIPTAVRGVFGRNGPNPKLAPTGAYHWFDGDGMIHAVRLKDDGTASYSRRWVQTAKLSIEDAFGQPFALKFGDMSGYSALPKLVLNSLKQALGLLPAMPGTANTALAYHAGRLLALHEGDLPYALKIACDGVMETIGAVTFSGKLQGPFTAHPKLDPRTGTMYGFSYDASKAGVMLHVVNKAGVMERSIPIPMPHPIMMHDFAITENYAVFMDFPLVFKPETIVKGLPFVFCPELGARVGIIPLNATDASSMKWFQLPKAVFSFHTMNAWEEDGKVVLVLSLYDTFDITFSLSANSNMATKEERPYVARITMDLATGEASVEPISSREEAGDGLEFPQLNRQLLGAKIRFGYSAVFSGTTKDPIGVVKHDLDKEGDTVIKHIEFGPGRHGGEVLFVGSGKKGAKEDDGSLVTFVHDAATDKSELCVWDAKTMDPKPVATVKLPDRVPLGFHALHITEEELAAQAP